MIYLEIQNYKFSLLLLIMMCILSSGARCNATDDANAGLTLLNTGNYASAINFLTHAIRSGKLSSADRELAFVKRAQAYMGLGRKDLAANDVQQALRLSPNDAEAIGLQQQARGQTGTTTRIANPIINGQLVDHCASVNGYNDCTDAGELRAASAVCVLYGKRKAESFDLIREQGSAVHLEVSADGRGVAYDSQWPLLPTGAMFAWIECSS